MAHSTDEMENKGVNTIPNYRKWVADNIKVKAHVGGGIMEECIDQMLVRLQRVEGIVADIEYALGNLLKEQSCPSIPTLSVGLPDPTLKPSARSKKASKL